LIENAPQFCGAFFSIALLALSGLVAKAAHDKDIMK